MPVSAERGYPAFFSRIEATRAYAGGSLLPVDVASEQFGRIHAHNERTNACTLIDEERALQAVPAFQRDRAYPADFGEFSNRRAWTPYTLLFNLNQQPAISVPAGLTRDGLPIGLHIVGSRNAEAKILREEHAYEPAAPFTQRPSL